MSSLGRNLLLLIAICCYFSVKAQDENIVELPILYDDILFTEVNPLHPFGVLTLDRPFYIGTFNKRGSKFSIGYSMGNNWHPESSVLYPNNLTEIQKMEVNELYMTQRPYYFLLNKIPVDQKTFSSDGVLQNLSFTYLWQLREKGSFIFKLNTHLLSGGTSFIHHYASDDFIEWFHDQVGLHDNFGRYQYIFNRAHIEFIDEHRRTLRIDKGEAFLGTLDVNYYKPIWRRNGKSIYHSFQMGVHLALPLNKYYPKVAGGLSAAFLMRVKLSPKFNIDLGGDFSVINHSILSFGESANLIDKKFRNTAKSYLSFNFLSKKNKQFSFGLINNYQDALLDGYIFSHHQDKYKDLGVSYLQKGDVWEGVEIKDEFRLAKLTAASMYFFSLKSYIFMQFKWPKSEFSFNVGEDYFSVNNAPDIQYGFRYTRKIGK